MTFYLPFDFDYWFLSAFAGSAALFIYIAFIVIMLAAAYFRMPSIVAIMGMITLGFMAYGTGVTETFVIFMIIIGVPFVVFIWKKFIDR